MLFIFIYIGNTHDACSRKKRHKLTPFSGASFWYTYCSNRGLNLSGIRFRRQSGHCSKPKSGVHVTEKIIYDLYLFNLPLATTTATITVATLANSSSTSLSATFIFSTRNFFIPDVCGTKNGCRKPAPENGVD